MIKRIYCMTIDYRKDRQIAMETACAILDIPGNRFEFVFAPCGNDILPDTSRELAQRMVDDGFEEWQLIVSEGTWMHPTWLASCWSKIRLLRRIADEGDTAMFLSDTNYPRFFWFPQLEEQVESLDPFSALFLGGFTGDEEEGKAKARRMQPTSIEGIRSNMTIYARPAAVFTALGARKYLDKWRTMPNANFQDIPFHWADEQDSPDLYMCDPERVKDIPTDSGYSFVKTDKANWGPFYTPPKGHWTPAGTGGL